MQKKLVIFDLDGTLLYTVPDIAAATNQALAACGYPVHSETEIASYIGNGINKLFERALPEEARSQEEVLRIRSLFLPYYGEHCADMTRPFEGIPELLSDICRRGIEVAGKPEPVIVWDILREAGIHCPAADGPGRNFPDERQSVLYIGDSGVDMQTAANAGLEAVAVTWGCRTREELASYSPAHIVDSPSQIAEILF